MASTVAPPWENPTTEMLPYNCLPLGRAAFSVSMRFKMVVVIVAVLPVPVYTATTSFPRESVVPLPLATLSNQMYPLPLEIGAFRMTILVVSGAIYIVFK